MTQEAQDKQPGKIYTARVKFKNISDMNISGVTSIRYWPLCMTLLQIMTTKGFCLVAESEVLSIHMEEGW